MKSNLYKAQKQVEQIVEKIKKRNISKRNKELILDFKRYALLNNMKYITLVRYLIWLPNMAQELNKDFDKATKRDIEDYVQKLHEGKYSLVTKINYKMNIKRFYKWLKGNDVKYPKEVEWIKTSLKRTDRTLPGEGDLITEEEVKKLIDTAEHPRDKAFISCLYESGCRVSEMHSIRIMDVTFDENGAVISVSGKTGSRRIRLISSVPFLSIWLNNHPLKQDRESLVWIAIGAKSRNGPISYTGIYTLLQRAFKKAGINKKFHPHLFRHSRATYLANYLTEFQMNQYFGWVQGSPMPSTYVHMSGKTMDSAILELNGVKTNKEKAKESELKPKMCPRCDTMNGFNDKFCGKCGGILDIKTAIEMDESVKKERKSRGVGDKLITMLMGDEKFKQLIIDRAIDLGIGEELVKNIG